MSKHNRLELFRRSMPAEIKFVILILLSVVLLLIDTQTKLLDSTRQVISFALYPAQKTIMFPRDIVVWGQDVMNAAELIQSENEALQRQRIELAQVTSSASQLSTENAQLRRLLNMIDDKTERSAVVAEILYEAATPFNRRLIFDRGQLDGVAPGMPVIDEGGVVGQIVRVTPVSSEAALLTDEVVSVPVQLARTGLRLIAFGSNLPGKIEVRYFSSDADIRAGDVLITSGIGGAYPPGLMVGKIESIDRDAASGFARAIANPSSNPDRYRHFLILRAKPSRDMSAVDGQAGNAADDPSGGARARRSAN